MTILDRIEQKVESQERITPEEATELFLCDDLVRLGQLANRVRERIHGNQSYFILNHHIDYSNICVLNCRFCAFSRKPGDADGFELTVQQMVDKVKYGLTRGITEIHVVGGFHPTHPWEFYLSMLREIKKVAPKLHIKAFTAAEIRYFSKKFRFTQEEVLLKLREAGLDSMPGGGAEIFNWEVRKDICGPKGRAEYWLETHKLAHSLGFKSTGTMLYGHVESIQDRVDHMNTLRDLQDQSGGFMCFIPLAFNPKDTQYESKGYTSGVDDLKTLAVSRLFFDNIRHIKAYWIMSGLDMAQIGQYFGADDVHGTVIEENITHMAGAVAPEDLAEASLIKLISDSGRVPVQRDSLYNIIKVHEVKKAA